MTDFPLQRWHTDDMKTRIRGLLLLAVLLLNGTVCAHPGSGIVVDSQGNVFVGDINRGLVKFTPQGNVSVVLKEAGHWLAVDGERKFARMDFEKSGHWPRWF